MKIEFYDDSATGKVIVTVEIPDVLPETSCLQAWQNPWSDFAALKDGLREALIGQMAREGLPF